ncbi:MAG: transcriptional regulator NrdR [Gammaproteobacteria bacterium]|nr:transcriptional regulator NrdR [bacterium AH-315-E07]PCH61123.1 MAG: transcriptional regulator NrdR [Gammaproteobacteria bacterium]
MRCPFCDAQDTRVVDSRLGNGGDSVRRRRECNACGERFTTHETAELNLPRVLKQDSRREPFDEDKLRNGILRALEKRPVNINQVEDIIHRIKHRLLTLGEREVDTKLMGSWVMQELKELDAVAYVRFASVYHSFEDIEAFKKEIEGLEKGKI